MVLQEFLDARFENLFHRILMHQKIGVSEFRDRVKRIAEAAKWSHLAHQKASVVAFIDEFNTTFGYGNGEGGLHGPHP